MNIQDLIKACKKRNRQAEKELFLLFAPKVLTLCRRYIPDEHRAQDLMQDCFIKVFENIGKYDSKKGDFGGWIFRVCTNTVLKYLRNSKKEVPTVYLENLPEEGISDTDFEEIPTEKILESIRELPAGYRQVLNLFIFENWSHKEIAKSLNITESTSRSQLTRAKKILKIILEKKDIRRQTGDNRRINGTTVHPRGFGAGCRPLAVHRK